MKAIRLSRNFVATALNELGCFGCFNIGSVASLGLDKAIIIKNLLTVKVEAYFPGMTLAYDPESGDTWLEAGIIFE